MKPPHLTRVPDRMVTFAKQPRTPLVASRRAIICAAMGLSLLLATSPAEAQAIRFQIPQVRVTVPVGTTNSSVITGFPATNNTVILVNGATNAVFDVSGLPPGASAVLTDGNGNALTATSNSTNLWLTLNTTNIPQGLYKFSLNAGGFDTNGLPVTNSMPFVLQSAHIWKGTGLGAAGFGSSNNWSVAANWLGGSPAAADDVVFSDSGAQTNATFATGIAFTNIGIDASLTVASIRFAQNTHTNLISTNTLYHTLRIAPGATLAVTGTNGFSLLRDYINDFGVSPDNTMGVNLSGTNATLLVSNASANFGILLGNSEQPTLSISNLGTFVTYVSRMGFADYQIYPNYRAINNAYNGGRDGTNYSGFPRRIIANVYLARTNYLTATYKDPDNYTNEFTRGYAITLQNNEQSGNGSSVNTFFYLGLTNVFRADSICFIGASSASGSTGGTKYNIYERSSTNPGSVFRGTNGTSRMSMFCVSDDGGTNQASSNVKATIDFSAISGTGQGYIDLLADRLYVARDRTMISSNQSPNVQGDLTFGNGTVDVNTMILGYQEHSNKVDWTSMGAPSAYLNYCQGKLTLTNGGYVPSVVKINGNLTLGYTADMNPVGSAQQYNTYGQVTIYSNVTMSVSNVICDGGLNYYDGNKRRNTITVNRGGNLVVSNMVGFPNPGANDFSAADPRGMLLDSLTINGGRLTVLLDPAKTNVFVRDLATGGIVPGVIKVAALTGVSSFPVQIPVISYQGSSSPFLNADVSALGAGYFGYVLNNIPKQTVDVYITTNQPNNLVWTGSFDNLWNTTTKNWVTAVGGLQTNFSLGDLVTFNDSSTVTNVNIDVVTPVVPGQTGVGVTISNSLNQYTFSGGTIAGTALVAKQGTNVVQFDATEQGPINLTAGSLVGSGQIGTTIVYSNVVLNWAGSINGGLTSTGTVTLAAGSFETGPVSIQGGSLVNAGTIVTLTSGSLITMANGTAITNLTAGKITVGSGSGNGGAWDVGPGSTLANFGSIYLYTLRITVEGLLFGNGVINDPNGGGYNPAGNPGLVRVQGGGVIAPGVLSAESITNMSLQCRFDNDNRPTGITPPGIGTLQIEVDFNNPVTNDFLYCDRWNDLSGILQMTNINPGFRSFKAGDTFQIFVNTSGNPQNFIDLNGYYPQMSPYVPAPGLQWGLSNLRLYGGLSVTNSALVWDGNGSGSWDTNGSAANWKSGQLFADNQGAIFDDSASGSTIVNLTTNVAPASYPFIAVTNIVPNVSTNIVITTNDPTMTPGIVVSNATKTYVITGPGKISGMTGIYKTGPGTLTLMTSNDFTGNVIVDNGTLVVTNYPGVSTLVSLGRFPGTGLIQNQVILDGGILSCVGNTNATLNNFMVFNAGGATIGVTSATNTLTLGKAIIGTGALNKIGNGTLLMNQASDVYAGGTTVSGGTLLLTAAAAGYGGIALNNNASLQITNNLTITNTINVAGAGTVINILGTSTNIFGGNWLGGGSVTFSNSSPFIFNGDLSGFSGTLSFGTTSAAYEFNSATNKNPCTGSAAATFNLGTGSTTLSNLNGNSLVYNLGALAGGPNTTLAGRATNNLVAPPGTTYSIGANGSSTTFAGKIADGLDTVSVIKVGSGSLSLAGNSTYTGSTTVSNGVLGGTGSIVSPLTVVAGGTLSPGASVGTFTVSNSVNLAGTVLMELNRTNSPATNDLLVVTGSLTGGGVLVVTNLGPDIYNGSTFKLFSKPVSGFSTIALPTTDPTGTKNYTWVTNLAVDGSIQLVSGGTSSVNTNATNLGFSLAGHTLTLNWPADHIGWRLQVQTNNLSIGINTNWATVSGSTNVNSVPILIDPSNGTVFYRLIYP